jgi:hypothetical protein
MSDFVSLVSEKFPKIYGKIFSHPSNGFLFKKDQTLILKNNHGDKNPKW